MDRLYESGKRFDSLKKWGLLLLGLAVVAVFIAVAHLVSPSLPGAIGVTYRHNRDAGIDANALIYTEAGDVREFLNDGSGRYASGLPFQGRIY